MWIGLIQLTPYDKSYFIAIVWFVCNDSTAASAMSWACKPSRNDGATAVFQSSVRRGRGMDNRSAGEGFLQKKVARKVNFPQLFLVYTIEVMIER